MTNVSDSRGPGFPNPLNVFAVILDLLPYIANTISPSVVYFEHLLEMYEVSKDNFGTFPDEFLVFQTTLEAACKRHGDLKNRLDSVIDAMVHDARVQAERIGHQIEVGWIVDQGTKKQAPLDANEAQKKVEIAGALLKKHMVPTSDQLKELEALLLRAVNLKIDMCERYTVVNSI